MRITEISDLTNPRIEIYTSLNDVQLRQSIESDSGVFIAESPKVIRVALDSGYEPISLLCEKKHITGDAADIVARINDNVEIFTGSRELLSRLTGYTLTRGVLCAMKRKQLPPVKEIAEKSKLLAVIDGVCDTTNIGSIFRAAAALGVDGIALTKGSCDPLNRRSIRVSMGTVFKIDWTWLEEPISSLKKYGFKTLALALKQDSIALDNPKLKLENKLAIILGTEGDGLCQDVINDADYSVIIPMFNNVDSLNVASAAAIAFWELKKSN